ncbi:hypothetical protein [Photobacterium carnosum]|uniref:hypothetical protein n=1 Tax=Photobacterium carnosum TaxID=2023717 RepID=UPI001E429607|nr:hypothetical protein [Photobacterium carnosum]MCD9516423.1 hypothetical protein [Photobacterium carnosum]
MKTGKRVDAALKMAKEQQLKPKPCPCCHGKGETKGLFGDSLWECFHCDGTGYSGNAISIAKWFRAVLMQRTKLLLDIRNQFKLLQAENNLLKQIYPDWKERINIEMAEQCIRKNHSRFD